MKQPKKAYDPDEQPRFIYVIEEKCADESEWSWHPLVCDTLKEAREEISRKRCYIPNLLSTCFRVRRYVRDTRWRP